MPESSEELPWMIPAPAFRSTRQAGKNRGGLEEARSPAYLITATNDMVCFALAHPGVLLAVPAYSPGHERPQWKNAGRPEAGVR